jgi:hypothetical protein
LLLARSANSNHSSELPRNDDGASVSAALEEVAAARGRGDVAGAVRLLHSLFLNLSGSENVAAVQQVLLEAERLAQPGHPNELQALWLAQQARLYLRPRETEHALDEEIARAEGEMRSLASAALPPADEGPPTLPPADEGPATPTPAPDIAQPRPLAGVRKCQVIGGHGLRPRPGETWDVLFYEEEIELVAAAGGEVEAVPYVDVVAIELGGSGATRSGGGFFGGGEIGRPAEEGILLATALNLLTTRTNFEAIICIQTANAELFLRSDKTTPDALRIALSPVLTKVREIEASRREPAPADSNSAIDQLVKLARLLEKGLISEDEFAKLKGDLLG